jgi:dipeptidyl aminopeptidase/acylaminoacyl peptidase
VCPAQTPPHIAPEDLLRLRNITDVVLSPDGRRLAFVVHEASLRDDRYKTSMWVAPVDGQSPPRKVMDDASSVQWSPDGKQLACIRPHEGHPQITVLQAETGDVALESTAPTGVVSFQWSPSGSEIAFLSREPAAAAAKPGDRKGAVIDKRTFNVYLLLGNDIFLDLNRPVHLYLLNVERKSSEMLIDSFHVDGVAWAPDGKSMAVTGKEAPQPGYPASVYLYSLPTRKAVRILQGTEKNRFPTLEFTQPVWSPDGSELAAVSKTSEDRWANSGVVGIYSLGTSQFRPVTDESRLELYAPRFFWRDEAGPIFENTVQADTELFRLTKDGTVQPLTRFGGDNSSFAVSSSGDEIAFVHDDVQHPPEVYIARAPFTSSRAITAVNAALASLPSPRPETVHWKGAGGVDVEGLLLKPPAYTRGKRYPMLVMVHGGPGVAIKDAFEPYSLFAQWAWPYPFRIFADRGYLVFIPNYRGTGSFGKPFRLFRDMAGEPADDIVAGVEFLEARGDADPKLVGILGHSHGGWLGPYVLTHHRELFKAASFAEGALDTFSQYGLMPGWLNLYTHEFYNPGTPYDNTQRYIAISPIFAMKGLTTPTLLEFGQRSLAMLGLESATAMWREGVPHEMVVYPGEGHNLASPVLQLDSIQRNLDWFDYWMLGKRDPDPKKQEQYARWEKMTREMEQVRNENVRIMVGRTQSSQER